jgi:hypothetical protein
MKHYLTVFSGQEEYYMTKNFLLSMTIFGLLNSFFYVYNVEEVYAGEISDEMKKMQEQLNDQVLSKPFSVTDEAKVKAYIEDAQRKGEVPQSYKGKHWRPGYTCYDLRPYSYREYLSCRYYYSYYGHYYR